VWRWRSSCRGGFRGWRVLRTIYFLPNVISIAALALVYLTVYNPRYGLLNQVLAGSASTARATGSSTFGTALPAVAATWVFTAGVVMILVMAEIAAIPSDVYDAALVDGASRWQVTRHVTLPLLRNAIGVCTILVLLATIGYFDGVYIMTGGGPANHTLTLALYAFQEYSNSNWGYANAVGVVLVALGLIAIITVRRAFRIGSVTTDARATSCTPGARRVPHRGRPCLPGPGPVVVLSSFKTQAQVFGAATCSPLRSASRATRRCSRRSTSPATC